MSEETVYSEELVRELVIQGIRETNKHIIENGTMKGVDAKHYAQKWIEKKLKEIENRE